MTPHTGHTSGIPSSVATAAWWSGGVHYLDVHALRLALTVLALVGLVVLLVRRRARRRAPDAGGPVVLHGIAVDVWLRYTVIGAVLGVAWLWGTGLAPWEHALRLAALVVVLAPSGTWLWNRHLARTGRSDPATTRAHVRGWVLAKLALVAGALGLQVLLERRLSVGAAADVVAATLLATSAVAGPLLHERLTAAWRVPSTAAEPTGLSSDGGGGLDKAV